jgi:hypothetical protein
MDTERAVDDFSTTFTFSLKFRIFELTSGDKFMGREYEPGWYTEFVWWDGKHELIGPANTRTIALAVVEDGKRIMMLGSKNALGNLRAQWGGEGDAI